MYGSRSDGRGRPLFTVRLTQDDDGCWTVQPLGLERAPAYRPERIGPTGPRVRGCDVVELVYFTARAVVAAALDLDHYSFHLRFLSSTGVEIATSVLRHGPWGPEGETVLHELIAVSPELRAQAEQG